MTFDLKGWGGVGGEGGILLSIPSPVCYVGLEVFDSLGDVVFFWGRCGIPFGGKCGIPLGGDVAVCWGDVAFC